MNFTFKLHLIAPELVAVITHYGEMIMAEFPTVKDELAKLVAREDTIIQIVKDLQAGGTGATPEQLNELLALITAQEADQDTVIPT